MPNRIIRESALASASLAELSGDEERLWWRLTIVADDFGRFDADPAIVASRCFPRWRTLKAARVERWLQALVAVGGVGLYEHGGARYGVFLKWGKHQMTRAKSSKYPEPPNFQAVQTDDCGREQTQTNVPVFVFENRDTRSEIREARTTTLPPLAVLWNEIVKAPAVLRVSGTRADHLRARMGVYPDLDWWRGVLERIVASPFLRGKNDRGWAADFDWLIRNDENPARVLEGKYDTKRQVDPPPPRAAIQDLPDVTPEQIAEHQRKSSEMIAQLAARKTL